MPGPRASCDRRESRVLSRAPQLRVCVSSALLRSSMPEGEALRGRADSYLQKVIE